jgi:hypothetical protein
MKKIMIFAALISGFVVLAAFNSINTLEPTKTETITVSDYCDGWEAGYCEGWKDVKGQYAICPIAPICPIPEIGKEGYRGGYNRGFKAGMKKAKKY